MSGVEVNSDEGQDQDESTRMPWAQYDPYFCYVREKDKNNFEVKCKQCAPSQSLSCATTSSGNLKKHLQKKHKWTEAQLEALRVAPPKKPKKGDSTASGVPASDFFKKRRVSQSEMNKAIDEFIIHETQPYSVVDSPYFKKLVLLGRPSNLTVNCRQTEVKRIEKHFENMKKNLVEALRKVPYVATGADGWTKYRRGFLGVTSTWLDPNTLARNHAALAIQRLKGRHTHQRLAYSLHKIHEDFELKEDKLVRCTTDSASNFKAAFRVFSSDQSGASFADEEDFDSDEEDDTVLEADDPNIDDWTPLSLDDILSEEDLESVHLPPHQRCGSHIINLMATTDAKEALDINSAYKRVHDSTDIKLRTWWRRQNKSNLVAEAVQDGFGVKFEVPGATRWNSEFDAKKQIVDMIEKLGEDQFNVTIDSAGLPKLVTSEIKYLREYVWVLQPVALALDILQRDKEMYAGYLIPVVLNMERNLMTRQKMGGKVLKYCDVLRKTLLAAIRKPNRFQTYLEDRELAMGSVLLPTFKFNWTQDEGQRNDLKAALIKEAVAVAPLDSPSPNASAASSSTAPQREEAVPTAASDENSSDSLGLQTEQEEDEPVAVAGEISLEDDFFGFQPLQTQPKNLISETAEEEVERYLSRLARSETVQDCYAKGQDGSRQYPRLARLFLRYNTALPSSASVERLFWRAGQSLSSLRNRLGDNHFQQELLLKVNAQYWGKED